jgi:twitching motility two-component system response regulator PilG
VIKTEPVREDRAANRSGEADLLLRAIELARSGEATAARVLLVDICRKNNQSELGWLWLASVARNPKEALACIKQVLRINPANEHARAWLAKLTAAAETAAAPVQETANAGLQSLATGIAAPPKQPTAAAPPETVVHVTPIAEPVQQLATAGPVVELAPAVEVATVAKSEPVADAAPAVESIADVVPVAVEVEQEVASPAPPAEVATTQAQSQPAAEPSVAEIAVKTVADASAHEIKVEPAVASTSAAKTANTTVIEPQRSESKLTVGAALWPRSAQAAAQSQIPVATPVAVTTAPPKAVATCPICEAVLELPERCDACKAAIWPTDPMQFVVNRQVDREVAARLLDRLAAEPESVANHLRMALACCNLLDFAGARNHMNSAALTDIRASMFALDRVDAFLRRPTVLVVDDSATIRDVLVRMLAAGGMLPIPIAESWAVLSTVQSQAPAAVLLDVTMPMMDGYEVCRQIRSNRESKGLPVIMVSGHDGLIDKVVGKLAGASDYVSKPFKQEKLMKIIRGYVAPKH